VPSNLIVRFAATVAGSPIDFANPFFVPALTLEAEPALYNVVVPAATAAMLWDGVPLTDDFDALIVVSTTDCDIEFTVDGGNPAEYHFTLFSRGGGFPLVLWGSEVYAGQAGTEDAFTFGTVKNITTIRALNRDADTDAVVSVLLGKESA